MRVWGCVCEFFREDCPVFIRFSKDKKYEQLQSGVNRIHVAAAFTGQ